MKNDINNLLSIRNNKINEMRKENKNPYSNDVDQNFIPLDKLRNKFNNAKINDKYDSTKVNSESVCVVGRIIFQRNLGAIKFYRIKDQGDSFQLQITNGNNLDLSDLNLDIGDIVEAKGKTCVSMKGELAVELDSMKILTKSIRSLPTKFGIADQEEQYRQRYVDLNVNKNSFAVFKARSLLIKELRNYFDNLNFTEVETPMLNNLLGGASAKPFSTHHNSLDMNLYMRIAPELYLKRLIVGGFDKVYEIGKCFRNEGLSTRHNPEFTMLEFYEAYSNFDFILNRTKEMLKHLDSKLKDNFSQEYQNWIECRTFSFENFVIMSMKDAVNVAEEKAKEKDRKSKINWTSYDKDIQNAKSSGHKLFISYEYLAEPFLTEDYRSDSGEKSLPVFITQYPVEVSPLARKNNVDPSFTDRFELFIDGKEIANCFCELNDPRDQEERFKNQIVNSGDDKMDYDEDYIQALEYGMPPTVGFGMGIDRLVMCLTAQSSIKDVILFPLMKKK
jgi:lysyl-tRNA synthetase class 2